MIDKLKKLTERMDKNKESIGFTVEIKKSDNKTFKLQVKNLNDKRYEKAIQRLCLEMIEVGKEYILDQFLFDPLNEDVEMEHLRFDKTMDIEMELLLNSLINYGFDTFIKNVAFLSTKYKQLYELANARLNEKGEIVDRFGNKIA